MEKLVVEGTQCSLLAPVGSPEYRLFMIGMKKHTAPCHRPKIIHFQNT